MANARWVPRNMLDTFRTHPKYKPKDIRAEVMFKMKVKISYWTAWHARWICLEKIMGNYEESYKLLPELCTQVLSSNPGSTATISTYPHNNYFRDVQECLIEAVKKVFTEELMVNHFHRNYFRHLYKNFKKVHPGLNLEKITWAAANLYTKPELKP
ncbi:hypothetical protein BVC80_1481g31 [Macleaya cordata]|uniref:Uncharacterized protein n=1 Tax=Macleaya cordata TaxID=56857 RepID=A0A200QNI9_MACCD|nr:hypothetical protein BVC80_1481g31 [Macleaya cordata]